MSYICVDIESDGPLLGVNSMVCLGAVLIDKDLKLDKTFYAETAPISNAFNIDALAISGFSRKEHELFRHPKYAIWEFEMWIEENSKGKPILLSDNNQYDGSWINWYFHTYSKKNPFGYSSRRIGDMFAGFMNNPYYSWKKHRKTVADHNPVNDAKGNAEALIWLQKEGFNIKFK